MSSARLAASASHGDPIQVVVRRTGLSADVIRAWEKRYAVVTPARTDAGRRLYSDADVERLRQVARATLTGRTVGQLAALPPEQLAALARDDAPRTSVGPPADAAAERSREYLRTCLDALARFDAPGLDAALRHAAIALSAEAFLESIVVRLWERVGDGVHHGTLRPAHQHLAHAVLRRVLDRVAEAATPLRDAPQLLVATPPGQSDELGALLAAAAAAAEGWRVVYLGPGLPAEDIADAATQVRARAVTLSLGATPGDRVTPRELRRLRTLLPDGVALVVKGSGAEAHRRVLGEIGAPVLRDVPSLLAQLRTLRAESAGRADKPARVRAARAVG
jgi:DNA-binding transcriptional MerR regulator/methylmalonyl-CoA mutase cobalamin-binding subunit